MNEEMKSVMAALDAIEKKMSENASKEEMKALQAQYAELQEKQVKLSKQLLDLQQKGLKLELPKPKAVKSIGEQDIEHESIKTYLKGGATN